jgi:hypothetical protein
LWCDPKWVDAILDGSYFGQQDANIASTSQDDTEGEKASGEDDTDHDDGFDYAEDSEQTDLADRSEAETDATEVSHPFHGGTSTRRKIGRGPKSKTQRQKLRRARRDAANAQSAAAQDSGTTVGPPTASRSWNEPTASGIITPAAGDSEVVCRSWHDLAKYQTSEDRQTLETYLGQQAEIFKAYVAHLGLEGTRGQQENWHDALRTLTTSLESDDPRVQSRGWEEAPPHTRLAFNMSSATLDLAEAPSRAAVSNEP